MEHLKTVAEVVVLNRGNSLNRTFHYLFAGEIRVGQRVNVPFGNSGSIAEALIVGFTMQQEGAEYKEISSILDEEPVVDEVVMKVAKYISEEYLCSFQEAISLFFPKGEKVKDQGRKVVLSIATTKQWEGYLNSLSKNAKVKRLFAEMLQEKGEVFFSNLKERSSSASKIIEEFLERSLVKIEFRKEAGEERVEMTKPSLMFNREQKAAIERVWEAHTSSEKKRFLLHGVTGSGKTEVYIELIRRNLQEGLQSIVLVPEISLTPQTISRFERVFGNAVAFMHSALTEKQKKLQWEKMRDGRCLIAIGPRSALFVPFQNLGMIIVDECHADAYKSEQTPKYDAVQVSLELGRHRGATVILGSATPSIVQLYEAKQGNLELLHLMHRSNGASFPKISLIDMREELKRGNNSMISAYLYQRMKENLTEGNQTILFLNKRGFSKNLTCTSCGYVHKCPNCDITLSYHKRESAFKCHYCNYQSTYSKSCPNCGGELKDVSFGTEKIEEQVKELLPEANILRMDRDTVKERSDYERLLSSFSRGEKNVLIGTQMIGKGLDFPGVTLVGVLQADQGMDLPDFRGTEKAFQMLEQVSGRAGRGAKQGESVIQSFHIERSIFSYLYHREYQRFYEEEIAIRKAFGYPPYGQILRILITSVKLEEAAETAKRIEQALTVYFQKADLRTKILGPAPCLINRLESKYRWQIILKGQDRYEVQKIISILKYIQEKKRKILYGRRVTVVFEKNPYNIL